MKCLELESLLLEYLDGELDSHGESRVDTHLEECEACRALVDEHRLSWELLIHDSPVLPSSETRTFVDGVISRHENRPGKLTIRSRLRMWAPWLVAAAVLVGSFLWWSRRETSGVQAVIEDAEVVAELDLLMDFDLLTEFSTELDVRRELELLEILSVDEEGR